MKQLLFLFFFAVLSITCKEKIQQFSVVNLRCEHLVNPIGLDTKTPRFSWQLDSETNGITQESYQIIVGTDPHFTLESQIWDSGRINSDGNLVPYAGPALKPFTTYFWGVHIWDNRSANAISEIFSFETGMMDMANWKGSWITDTRDIDLKAAPYFRKEFASSKKIKSARAYIAVAGLYELTANFYKKYFFSSQSTPFWGVLDLE